MNFVAQLPRPYVNQSRGRAYFAQPLELTGSPGKTRTCDKAVNSRSLYQLSYRGSVSCYSKCATASPVQSMSRPGGLPRAPALTHNRCNRKKPHAGEKPCQPS